MGNSYNWGIPEQPEQTSQRPSQTATTTSPNAKASRNSGLAKKMGVGAVAVMAVAALGAGSFQIFKVMQSSAPHPLGITDEVARDLVGSEFDDCMLTPELIQAAGIKDLKQSENEDNTCVGYFDGPDGNNNVEVKILVKQSSSGAEPNPDIEGWKSYVNYDDPELEAPNFNDLVEALPSYSPTSYTDGTSTYLLSDELSLNKEGRFCRLEGEEREIEGVHLIGPSCDSIAPLANQIMNVVKQDIYNSSGSDFFEIKDKPTYVETQPTTTVDITVPGFREAYDSVPELGTEMVTLEEDFDGSKFIVNNIYSGKDNNFDVCMDAVYTLGNKVTDKSRATFHLPSISMIGSDGSMFTLNKDYESKGLKDGESMDITYCGNYESTRILKVSNVEYVAVFSDSVGSYFAPEYSFNRDGVPNSIAKWSQTQDEDHDTNEESESV